MKEIVGVRFKSVGKIYYFSPGDIQANVGDHAIVETVRGVECGEVVIANRQIEDNEISSPLKPIIRIATEADMKTPLPMLVKMCGRTDCLSLKIMEL